MHEVLFGVFPVWPSAVALALIAGTVVCVGGVRVFGIPMRSYVPAHLLLMGAGLIGAKLVSVIERGEIAVPHGWEVTHGYRYPGAVLGLALAVVCARRFLSPGLGLATIGDIVAPAIGIAMGIVRLGCFGAGCCFGAIADVPWAIRFPIGSEPWTAHLGLGLIPLDWPSLPVHPLQLYFAFVAFAVGGFLLWFQPRRRYPGQVGVLYLALHEPAKWLLEYLRFPPLPHVQYLSLAGAIVGLAGVVLGAAWTGRRDRRRQAAIDRGGYATANLIR